MKVGATLLAFTLIAAPASAQTLGELAREHEAKRKTSPKATKTYKSQELYSATGEIAHYELTFERFHRFRLADMEVLKAFEKDPPLFARLESLRATRVSQLERFLNSEPALVAALRDADMGVREYAYTHTALATAEILMKQPEEPGLTATLTPTTRANIAFVKRYYAEIYDMHMQAVEVRARIKEKLK